MLTDDGFAFRDLNGNGRLDPYEDGRLPVEERVEDLLSRMTLEEKAGMMFHTMVGMKADGGLMEVAGPMNPAPTSELIEKRLMNHFNVYAVAEPRRMAEWHNRLQRLAEGTRLGIPVTISSDPRHSYSREPGDSILTSIMLTGGFSQWPGPIGLAATRDPELVKEFGDIARREYTAVGIRVALHPMADLATEPRWARIEGTFGEDAVLASRLVSAYVEGFQGEALGPGSVACMTKHFPGGGPQRDGEDPHFSYGKEQVYPGGNFDHHLIPFEAAFEAGTAQIMPYYGMPVGLEVEEVGFGFNKDVVTGLLRGRYGFDGVVCTDWTLLTPVEAMGQAPIEAKCWGVEDLSVAERARKAIDAGVDQFGGEACPEVVVDLVRGGLIQEARIDESVRRLLRDKFRLGLFDDPYVDSKAAERVVGNDEFRRAGENAQRRSIVLLKNAETPDGRFLPLRGRPMLYVENLDPGVVGGYGQVVESIEDADVAILRLRAPFEPREGFLERHFNSGDLDFKDEEKAIILNILGKVPTVVDIYLERPAVIPEIADRSAGLLADFGACDAAVLDVIFGRFTPSGKLPFEMPSSMDAVRRQKEDVPHDSEDPLFPFGHGLTY
ncbi:MAG: glycoside hydrolase family 3 C-terminal domain-containing protein [Candidatus Bathyarchaeota archaeon]|nr:MAG: glycoside hydrolase family 3 C-terminal domain-containing protein [Candidatus Bathyarchaeota archaeon]